MKKTLAVLLSLIMVFALIPAAFAETDDAAYRIAIEGGETKDNMEEVDGTPCLKVEVALECEPEEAGDETVSTRDADAELLCGITFDLSYDTKQLTFKDYEVPSDSKMELTAVNPNKEGLVKCTFASGNGAEAGDGMLLITLYFVISGDVKEGDEILFTLEDGAFAEVGDPMKPVAKDLGSDINPFIVAAAEFTGTVELIKEEVEWKGTTPYLVYDVNKTEYTPGFKVLDEEGNEVDPAYYDYEYKENTLPGTGYIFVYFKGIYSGEAMVYFKIYLPASEWLTVENVAEGIKLEWAPVEGAAGYVIYRRAWSTTTDGWTSFERWWNVTDTTWTDGVDSHKVYAGTRYQYGVKAYFERRMDPVAGYEIGGNVNENTGNWNLGFVSPLKTTVRITTRVLNEVTAGDKEMTIKWSASKNFTGYEVRYATNEAFDNAVTIKIDDWHIAEKTVTDLAAGTYYVSVRSYHEFEGFTYFGQWSNVLSCEVK